MKKLLLLLLSFCFAVACEPAGSGNEDPNAVRLNVTEKSVSLDGETFQVTVTSTASWTAECEGDWVELSKDKGDAGVTKVEVTCGASAEGGLRSAEVIFKTAGGEFPLYITQMPDTGFKKRVLVNKFTATWCGACPYATAALVELDKRYPESFIEIAMHGGDKISTSYTDSYARKFMVTGYPTLMFDMTAGDYPDKIYTSIDKNVEQYKEKIDEAMEANPAEVGIKVNTKLHTSGQVDVNVEAYLTNGGKYKIICAHTKSGYQYTQTGGDADYQQNHVLKVFMQADEFGDLLSDGDMASHSIFRDSYACMAVDKANAELEHIVVAILTENADGVFTVNNAVECQIGESIDYEFAE